ncbi:MAG: zinc ribbon domain-containing protein [Gemmatimonadaceae bacterium]
MKKFCNFCGEPLAEGAKECQQCGWSLAQDGPPSSDPADQKARIVVAVGLAVAYAVMWTLIQGSPEIAEASAVKTPIFAAPINAPEPAQYEAATGQPISVGVLPSATPATGTAVVGAKLLTLKVADDKAAHIQAHDALDYAFVVPETDQKCQLVGQLHGSGGFERDLETFLLTDDEYFFWHANPAAIPHSLWDTIRGSETALKYDLPGAGSYHLVISNQMSSTDKTVLVKAQVKCAR